MVVKLQKVNKPNKMESKLVIRKLDFTSYVPIDGFAAYEIPDDNAISMIKSNNGKPTFKSTITQGFEGNGFVKMRTKLNIVNYPMFNTENMEWLAERTDEAFDFVYNNQTRYTMKHGLVISFSDKDNCGQKFCRIDLLSDKELPKQSIVAISNDKTVDFYFHLNLVDMPSIAEELRMAELFISVFAWSGCTCNTKSRMEECNNFATFLKFVQQYIMDFYDEHQMRTQTKKSIVATINQSIGPGGRLAMNMICLGAIGYICITLGSFFR